MKVYSYVLMRSDSDKEDEGLFFNRHFPIRTMKVYSVIVISARAPGGSARSPETPCSDLAIDYKTRKKYRTQGLALEEVSPLADLAGDGGFAKVAASFVL